MFLASFSLVVAAAMPWGAQQRLAVAPVERLLAHVRDGYIDRSGKLVITLHGRHHGVFSNGRARVWTAEGGQDGKERWGYVDASGRFVIPPTYDWALPFSDDVAVVNVGATVRDPRFVSRADVVWARVEGGEWKVIDRWGKVLSTLQYDEVQSFKEGLAPVRTGAKWGYVDKVGNVVVSPQYDSADEFTDGMGPVRKGRKWGFVDKTGKMVVEPRYFSRIELVGGQVLLGVSYSKGFAWVSESGSAGRSWGVIDTTGKVVIEPQYEHFGRDFSDGLSAVSVEVSRGVVKKTRIIDTSGRIVAENNYEDVGEFHDGLAYFRSDKKHGAIDTSGKVVIEPQFDESFSFAEGLAVVTVAGKTGYIDKTGAWVMPAGDVADAWDFQLVDVDLAPGLSRARAAATSSTVKPRAAPKAAPREAAARAIAAAPTSVAPTVDPAPSTVDPTTATLQKLLKDTPWYPTLKYVSVQRRKVMLATDLSTPVTVVGQEAARGICGTVSEYVFSSENRALGITYIQVLADDGSVVVSRYGLADVCGVR